MFRGFTILGLILSLTAAVGCSTPASNSTASVGGGTDSLCVSPEDGSAVVAKSGDLTVTQQEFDAELAAIPERARARYNSDRGRKDISERILLNKRMFTEAEGKGLTHDTVTRLAARLAAQKAYVNALTQKIQTEAVSDAAIKKYYDDNMDKYARPMVRARHILLKDEAKAKEVKAKLDGGADFAELAKSESKDPGSGRRGGDLGWFTKERMVPEFSEAAFALEAGQVSGLVKSKFGWHIIETQEKRDVQPLEEVRPGIERLLSRNALKEYTDGIKESLAVEMVGPFAPSGDAAEEAPASAHAKPGAKPVVKPKIKKVAPKPEKAAH